MKREYIEVINGKTVALVVLSFLIPFWCYAAGNSYYSYQTGDWNSAYSWTTDPSGTIYTNDGNAVPSAGDNVVILNGRTIYTNAVVAVASTQINEGGTLNLKAVAGHNLGTVRGSGTLQLSTVTFPTGTFTEFVADGGGTVEYNNVTGTLVQTDYYNLVLRKTDDNGKASTITLASNLTVNGSLSISREVGKGSIELKIGNNTTPRTLVVKKDVSVGVGASISTNKNKAVHTLTIGGNFTNYGTVKFSNRTESDNNYKTDPTDGVVNVTFVGLSDNYVHCYGPIIFNKFTLDKGTDQTYVLTVLSSSTENFKLFGKNVSAASGDESARIAEKSLYIKNGTLKLEGSIFIPSLSEGGMDFAVPLTGCLWLNGDGVKIDINKTTSGWALSLIGKLRVDAGEIDTKSSAGVIFRGTAQLEINGGQLRAGQFRPSNYVDNPLTAYKQTGGVVIVDNIFIGTNNRDNDKPTFCLPFSTNSFNMTGGTLNISGGTNKGAFLFAGDPGNSSVTGGEINIIVKPNNSSYAINSTIPFYNLNIKKEGVADKSVMVSTISAKVGSANYSTAQQPLQVLNNLTLVGDDANRLYPNLNANKANVVVGRNFVIESGTTYTPSDNTTIFNGGRTQMLDVRGTISGNLSNMTITEGTDLNIMSKDITINKSLVIDEGTTLRDNGHTIYVAGNVTNSGTHFKPVTGAGRIELNGTAVQYIYGNGNGSFNNLTVNNTNGVFSNSADMAITGDLRLVSSRAQLKIGSVNLKFGADANVYSSATGTDQQFDVDHMISSEGSFSDAGVSKVFSAEQPSFLFPIGFRLNNANYYMPQKIEITEAPATYGIITTRAVNAQHPLVQNTKALKCYWKTTSTGFTELNEGSVLLNYYYNYDKTNNFVGGTESNYIPAALVYENLIPTWKPIENTSLIDIASNKVTYTADVPDGDYTAGELSAFLGLPIRYTSEACNDGNAHNWDDKITWSSESIGGPGGASVPSDKTVVVIGDATHNHTVVISSNNKKAGNLQIAEGSVLDVSTYTGHNFGAIPDSKVIGTGKLRVSCSASNGTATFPGGDFGLFLGESGGTVEYYSSGKNFSVPGSKATYRHLMLSPSAGQTITMPNIDLTVYGNCLVDDEGSVLLNSANAKSLQVNGNLNIENGTLQFMNNSAQKITVKGDLNIRENAVFDVYNKNNVAANVVNLYGNLSNNGSLQMVNAGRYCNVNFMGDANKQILGSGTNVFNSLNVDKGSDRNTILEVTADNLTLTQPLSLTNGTFRISNANLDISLSQNASFTIPGTTCLSANKGTFRIATGDSNDYDLFLNGRLEVLSDEGKIFVGTVGSGKSNDIEYSAAGIPEIVVNGGELSVNGQIRRSVKNASGSLSYLQTAGTVSIFGNSNNTTRGMLEVLNTGSRFAMSGGMLLVAKAGGSTNVDDVHIRPESSSVTGGTIQFGSSISNANQQFSYSASVPLWSIVVGTDAKPQTLTQQVLASTLGGNLTISKGSVYKANGLDLTMRGNLYNYNTSTAEGISAGGFQAGTASQTTTFAGASQVIAGTAGSITNFANLAINSTNNVTLKASEAAIAVNNDLIILSKTFNDGGNVVRLYGNAINDATHISAAGGGIHFDNATIRQTIKGNSSGHPGIFGNVTINNPQEVDMQDNMIINGALTLNGKLYIDDYSLTFGTSATIPQPAQGFSNARMIALNGALSDQGISKMFAAGASPRFLLPIGAGAKYTPAAYTVLANSAPGSVTVRPVDRLHPAVTDEAPNELAYYWSVDSTGFGSNLRISHEYFYLDDDVKPSGSDDTYAVGLYQGWKALWTNLSDNGFANVDENNNVIQLANVSYCRGDYTAGTTPNFGPVATFYSLASGNWRNATGKVWSLESHTGKATKLSPKGNPVKIAAGHTITITENKAYAASVTIDGVLDCGTTIFHNLGAVDGSGKIKVTSTSEGMFVFPGGDFDDFMATPSTIIEFNGDNNATLPLKPGNYSKPYQNVLLTGKGIKYMTAENMKMYGYMHISSGSVLSNALHNKDITIEGDWIDDNTAKDGFVPGTGTVIFTSKDSPFAAAAQKIDIKRAEQFYNFKINNPLGITFTGTEGICINRYLYLTSGIINTGSSALSMSSTSPSVVVGGSASSFVDGLFRKNIANGSYFTFPVGDGARYGKVTLNNVSSATSPQYWGATYYDANPSPTYPTEEENQNTPLTSVSDNEYWQIKRPSAADKANVVLRWDSKSYPLITGNASLRNNLRVVEFETAAAKWSERGASVSAGAQTVGTTTQVTNNDYIFTLGISGVTATIVSPTSDEVCNDGSQVLIPVMLTGSAPWTLTYRAVCGSTVKTFTQTGITSPNYNIVLRGSDLSSNSDETRTYTISLVSVSGNGGTGLCNTATTASVTVKQTFVPSISGAFAVGRSEQRTYSTAQHAGSTYSWSWNGASGGTISRGTTNSPTITTSGTVGTYQLKVVETSAAGCVMESTASITIINTPVPAFNPIPSAVACMGETYTYSTALVAGHEYRWTFVNSGTTTSTGWDAGANAKIFTWSKAGLSSVKVEERIAATPSIIGTAVHSLTVKPALSAFSLSADKATVCQGSTVTFTLSGSEQNVTYQLYNTATNANVGSPKSGTGNALTFSAAISVAGTYGVSATNGGCSLAMTGTPSIAVAEAPTIAANGFESPNPMCERNAVVVKLTLTGTAPYSFTIEEAERGYSRSVTGVSATSGVEVTYTFPDAPVWIAPDMPNALHYVIRGFKDASGCASTGTVVLPDLNIYKIPQTGAPYHIRNDVAQ